MKIYFVQLLRKVLVNGSEFDFKLHYTTEAENAEQAEKNVYKDILADFDLFQDHPEYLENLHTLLLLKKHGEESIIEEMQDFEQDLALWNEDPENNGVESEPKAEDYLTIHDSNVNYDFIVKNWSKIDIDDIPFDADCDNIVVVFDGESANSLGWVDYTKEITTELLDSLEIID